MPYLIWFFKSSLALGNKQRSHWVGCGVANINPESEEERHHEPKVFKTNQSNTIFT